MATADPATLPRLMLRCGTEDRLVAQNERFVQACAKHGVALDSDFGPGDHEWGYWDREIQTVLDWLAIEPELVLGVPGLLGQEALELGAQLLGGGQRAVRRRPAGCPGGRAGTRRTAAPAN